MSRDLVVGEQPKHHPECCLSLSTQLFKQIAALIDENPSRGTERKLTSVGCGSGVFEHYLSHYLFASGSGSVNIQGVEVVSARVPYIPASHLKRVTGTWDICRDATESDVLVFVYPRTASLVAQYLTLVRGVVPMIMWLGPRADWHEQEPTLRSIDGFTSEIITENTGLASYELMVIFRRDALQEQILHTATRIEEDLDSEIASL